MATESTHESTTTHDMLPNTNTHTFLNASSRLGLEQSSGSTDKTKRARHLPHLSSIARRVLAQPVCASAAERN